MTSPWEILELCNAEGICEAIRSSTGSPIVGEVVGLLASIPGLLERFYPLLRSALDSRRLERGADQLRRAGAVAAHAAIRFPDYLARLSDAGCSRDDIRQIRYITEAFYTVEPVFALISAITCRWVEGRTSVIARACGAPTEMRTPARFPGPIELVDESRASPFGRFGSVSHPFYRALGVWPEHVSMIREDLAEPLRSAHYDKATASIRALAEDISSRIPLPAPDTTSFGDDLRSATQRCLATSAEVVMLSCALRRMFIQAEIVARRGRLNAEAVRL